MSIDMSPFAEMCEDALYIGSFDKSGVIQIDWASPAFKQITGFDRQSVNGAGGLIQLVAPTDRAKADQQIQTVCNGYAEKCILHLSQSHNQLIRISHHLRPELSAEDGSVTRVYGIIRSLDFDEITSSTSEDRVVAFIRAIPEAITITDAEGVCLEYYPGRPEWLYPKQEELLGKNLTTLFSQEIFESISNAITNSVERDRAERVEFTIAGTDQTHWYESSIVPFGNGGTLSITRSITERKRAEEALRFSEERNRALLQAIPDMMFLLDNSGYYLDIHSNNPEDLIQPRSSHIGKHTYDVVPLSLAEHFLAANDRALKTGSMQVIEYNLDFEGSERIFEARIVCCGTDKVLSIVRNITERKKSEAALRASEEQNLALLQAIPDMMLLLRDNGEYVAIHSASDKDLFGERNEMLGRNVSDYVTEAEFTLLQQQIREVLNTRQMVIHEYVHSFSGELRYFESRIVPCGNDKVLSITRNITERKEAEQKLRLQNALLQAQLDATPEGIIAVDHKRKWIGVNQQFINMWKLTDEVIAARSSVITLRHVAQMVVDSEPFLEKIEKIYQDPDCELLDEVRLKDNRIFERRSRPILDIERNVLGRIWFYRDVTQDRKSESLLRAAEAEYRALFENMPIGIYRSAPGGHQLRSNPALVRLNGYSSEAEQLANVRNIATEWYVDPSRRAEFQRLLERDGEVHQFESEIYRHKTRERIWISEDALLIRDAAGNSLYYEGTVQDITQRKQAEEAIRTLNEQLQTASRLKDEFLKNISHEFRTPLTIVLTLSETISSGRFGKVNEQQKNALNRIQKQSHNLLEMVNNLLDMATLLSGTVMLQLSLVSLQDLCTHVLYTARELANEKKISITSTLDPTVKKVEADERRLGQIVQLLINNAIKFTPEGGEIGLDIKGVVAESQIKIIVWDTGIGIKPEDAQKLFQPFAQLDTTLSRRYEGAGLGLALAAQLTERHNGTITVESQPGQGARFIVALPWSPSIN